MIWKLLLYPVALIVDQISNFYFAIYVSQRPIFYRIGLFSLHLFPSRLNNGTVSTTGLFLCQVFRMFFTRFFTSIGGIVILALWGHEYSWQIFLAFLIVRERFFVALYDSPIPWFNPACLIGAWLGLALLAFLTASGTVLLIIPLLLFGIGCLLGIRQGETKPEEVEENKRDNKQEPMNKQIYLEMKDIFPLIDKARQAEDPLSLLLVFDLLHLKPGFTLKAFPYECSEGSIGNVWAMPETYDDKKSELIDLFSLPRPFPIENCCLDGLTMHGENILIRPAQGLDNIMDAIEGDRSLRSYFYASLFAREIAEFGASWHGAVWSCHVILGSDPWDFSKLFGWDMPSCEIFEMSEFEQFRQQRDNWIWLKTKPMDFRPFVALEKDIVTVRFYTYTGLVNQTIYCYTDTYKLKNYVFNSEVEPIADSGDGYII